MELQGKKATHDFLSLYTKDSTFQHPDPSPPSQGFFLKTHDFLRPLERPENCCGWRSNETTSSTTMTTTDIGIGGPDTRPASAGEHVLPGGIGTYSIRRRLSDTGTRGSAVLEPEMSTSGVVVGSGFGVVESKPEPDYDRRSSFDPFAAAGRFTAWEEKDSVASSKGPLQQTYPFAGRAIGSFGSVSAAAATATGTTRRQSSSSKKRFMDAATLRSSSVFDDEDDDEEELGRREDLTIKVDGKGSRTDQRPNTPRSKHSATEQRRRSKINDRFQILRDLIPHSDQKRDKASFLMEVIEYIRFLQEKVQKHESACPGWSQENTKLMPWVKVYFRSFWNNARNINQASQDDLLDPSQTGKNGSASQCMFTGKFDTSSIPITSAAIPNANNPPETDVNADVPYKSMETSFNCANNMENQEQCHWLRSSGPADCTVSSEMLSRQELTIDKATISVSAAYSQGLLTTLTQALQSSGVDVSQASISVQINLGKRAVNRRHAAVTTSNSKDPEDPASTNHTIGLSCMRSSGEEASQAPKRRRMDC